MDEYYNICTYTKKKESQIHLYEGICVTSVKHIHIRPNKIKKKQDKLKLNLIIIKIII